MSFPGWWSNGTVLGEDRSRNRMNLTVTQTARLYCLFKLFLYNLFLYCSLLLRIRQWIHKTWTSYNSTRQDLRVFTPRYPVSMIRGIIHTILVVEAKLSWNFWTKRLTKRVFGERLSKRHYHVDHVCQSEPCRWYVSSLWFVHHRWLLSTVR